MEGGEHCDFDFSRHRHPFIGSDLRSFQDGTELKLTHSSRPKGAALRHQPLMKRLLVTTPSRSKPSSHIAHKGETTLLSEKFNLSAEKSDFLKYVLSYLVERSTSSKPILARTRNLLFEAAF